VHGLCRGHAGLTLAPPQAATDITSRYDGKIVKIHYEVGDMAKTGTPLVDIEVEGDDAADDAAAAGSAAAEEAPSGAAPAAQETAAPVGQAPLTVGGKVRTGVPSV